MPETEADRHLREAWEKDPSVHKRLVSVQRQEGEGEGAAGGEIVTVSPPSDEQLAAINKFTRSPKSAEDVAVFPVMACNDVIDRDLDRFPEKTIKQFMRLPADQNPVGKSFMVGHNSMSLPIGRVFEGEATVEDEVNWLRLGVYIPNTPQYQAYLENVDYGIYWAVSVGVVLGDATCSVGKAHEWGWHPYICSLGHSKGDWYNPKDQGERYDPPPSQDAGADGAVMAFRDLNNPEDFYELSQVYLGAQFGAEFDKSHKPELVKAASFVTGGSTVKVLPLKKDEADEIPEPKPTYPEGGKFAAAVAAGINIEVLDDGKSRYKDADDLIYIFDPETEEELCLGKSESDDESEADDAETDAEVSEESPVETSEDKESEESDDTGEDEDDENVDLNTEDDDVPKEPLIEALRKSKHETVAKAVEEAGDGEHTQVAITALSKELREARVEIEALEKRATLGDEYMKAARADAIHWYTMAHRDPQHPEAGVKTNKIEELLTALGDNIDLVKQQASLYKEIAKERFPEAVRRSSFESDPNERATDGPVDPEASERTLDTSRAKRIHG